MKTQFTVQRASARISLRIGLFVLLVSGLIALLDATTAAEGTRVRDVSRKPGASTPAKTTTRESIRVTPDGVALDHSFLASKGGHVTRGVSERRAIWPSGNTLWMVADQNAIADGVRIDSNNVWGAWTLTGARLSVYPITGNGTPLWDFSSFNSGNTGVAVAKDSDRAGLMESNAAGNDFRQHGFRSTSNGTPDWSFQYPVSDPNLPASSFKVAVSRDGSTMAAVVSDSVTQNQTLYIFDAATGAIRRSWTNSLRMDAVALTDNGSIALVTQDNQATLIDTATGNIVFSVAGSGAGLIYYPISGDGSVFAVGGFNFDVYAFNGSTYTRVIHYSQASSWFGGASTVSRDGSTVGTFAGNYANGWLSGVVLLFDVPTGQLLGSYPVSGTGAYSGTPVGAASNEDGSVMAFASWGTQFHDWPEVMVFNRSVQLIGQINFPGSAFSVDVSSDGQYVVGGAKAVHANQFGNGGRIEIIQIQATTPTPTPSATATATATVPPSPTPTATATSTATVPPSPTPTPSEPQTPSPRPNITPRARPTRPPRPA